MSSGHEEVICRYCKKCFLIVVGPAENCIVICAYHHSKFIDANCFEKKIPFPTCILGTLHGSESLNAKLVCWSAFERMVMLLSKEVFKIKWRYADVNSFRWIGFNVGLECIGNIKWKN